MIAQILQWLFLICRQQTLRGLTLTSTVGVFSSEDSEKIDLLAELQAAAVLEG